jgi:hypothetical protein
MTSGGEAVNSFIARMFVLLNEVVSFVLLAVTAVATAWGTYKQGPVALLGGLAVCIAIVVLFGIAAIMIENHKLLKEIAKNTARET